MNILHSQELPVGRHALACRWIPRSAARLLDAGCSAGTATAHYRRLCHECHGIDSDAPSLTIARSGGGDIRYRYGSLERLPYVDAFFDTVVCTDVIEHVDDEIRALDELARVLQPGGVLILSVPHRGPLTLADPYNYAYYLRRYARPVYRALKKAFAASRPDRHIPHHRHYSLSGLRRLLDASAFAGHYTLDRTARTGFVVDVAALNVDYLLEHLPAGRVREMARAFVRRIGALDYRVRYGWLASNIAISIRKTH